MENVATEYGTVVVIDEAGKKKVNFDKSKFNSVMDLLGFLGNKTLTTQLLGY